MCLIQVLHSRYTCGLLVVGLIFDFFGGEINTGGLELIMCWRPKLATTFQRRNYLFQTSIAVSMLDFYR